MTITLLVQANQMKVYIDRNAKVFLEVDECIFVTHKKSKVVVEKRSRNELVYKPDLSPHHAAKSFLAAHYTTTTQARAWINRCLKSPEGASMYYIIRNDGTLDNVFANKKEANLEFSTMAEEDRLNSALYNTAEGLAGLDPESLTALHNSGMEEADAVDSVDAATVWAALENEYNPKVKAKAEKAAAKVSAKAPKEPGEKKERGPRVSYTSKSIAVGDKENTAREGSWRWYMVNTIMSAASVEEAQATHAASGLFEGKTLDFGWANREGYVVIS